MRTDETLPTQALAVVGMACRFPGADDVDAFWHNLRAGVSSVHRFSDEELSAAGVPPSTLDADTYVRARAVLKDIDVFDANFFAIGRREAEVMDPQHRLFLECAWHALEDAGWDPSAEVEKTGVFAGIGLNTYLIRNLMSDPELVEKLGGFQIVLGNDKDFVPTRAAYLLNLKGPSVAINTACSSSLVAVQLACQSLLSFQSDVMIAGGVGIEAGQDEGYWYQEGGVLSPDGCCRPFDADARGTIEGSGVGLVVLKRLPDAIEQGDRIHAVIRGAAINNDGAAKVGFTAPSAAGQAEVIAEALALAEVGPETLGYVEAHGTGTVLGDPVEVDALTTAFRTATDRCGYCALGSVKSNVGHLDTAAGVAGLIKAVLTVKHGEIPPSLGYRQPNPHIPFAETPFFVVDQLRKWPLPGPRRAAVSSFGIGGTNAHVILEEPPPQAPSGPSRAQQILLLSARSPIALQQQSEQLAAHLQSLSTDVQPRSTNTVPQQLADIAFTLARGRRPLRFKRALVANDVETAAAALRRPGDEPVAAPTGAACAFLLPGQGSQRPGMAFDLYRAEPALRQVFDRCAELVQAIDGWDLRQVVFEGTAEKLNETRYAQPALFATGVALAALWRSWGVEPTALIGHSVGELTGAHLAGIMSLEDAMRAVLARGRCLQAMAAGAMLGVNLPESNLRARLTAHNGDSPDWEIAAVNGEKRCVVAGPEASLQHLARCLDDEGVRCRRLHTSHAFHSATVDVVADELHQIFASVDLQPPQIPLVSNLSGDWLRAEDAVDPAYWVRQARATVRFSQGLGALLADMPGVLLELGPGSSLSTLAREHPAFGDGHAAYAVLTPGTDGDAGQISLRQALARAWRHGLAIDWPAYFAAERRRRVDVPRYPFERQRYWIAPKSRQQQNTVTAAVDEPLAPPKAVAHQAAEETHQARSAPRLDSPAARRRWVADLWRELLGVDAVQPEDDFFALGGHSLLGTVLVSRLRRDLDADLSLDVLFGAPTFDAFCDEIEARRTRDEAPGDTSRVLDLLTMVESLSEEEATLLLAGDSAPTKSPGA